MTRLLRLLRRILVLALAASALRAADATTFTREDLLASLTRELSSHFNLEGDLQLELVRTWVPSGIAATTWTVEVLDYPAQPTSAMLVRCRILADHAPQEETTFALKASLWRDAWVARQPLAVGEGFDPAQLEARRVDLFRERDVVPASSGDHGYVLARAVSSGRLLTWRDLTRRPLVRKGQLVEVSAVEGSLAITMKALAMENGAQGDTVTVRNPESRRDFSALVIDENRVQVRF